MNVYKVILHKLCRCRIYIHAVNENRGAEAVAPVDVHHISMQIIIIIVWCQNWNNIYLVK